MFAKRGHLQGQHREVQLGADGGRAANPQEEVRRRRLLLQSWSGLSTTGAGSIGPARSRVCPALDCSPGCKSTLLSSES